MMTKAGMLAVVGLMLAQSASALSYEITRSPGYYYDKGGEFTIFGTGFEAQYDSQATHTSFNKIGFQTFCLEKDEKQVMYPDAYTIDNVAINGGIGGPDPDPISIGTAWLYDQFARGVLAGYDYDPLANRSTDAGLLQEAFWWIEQELDYDASANTFVTLVAGALGMSALDLQAPNNAALGAYGVSVMNWTEKGIKRQSMLVRTPDGGVTMALLGLSIASLAVIRRRMA
jgi:hypothetical protein